MDKRATCRKILRKTALSVLAASILMTGTVDAVRAEETPNVLQTVEAESGTLLGKAKIAATGTCVSGLEHTGDGVEVTVTVPEDGLYDIIVRTAVIGGGTKVNELNANGQHVGDITNSGSWSDEVVPYVWLEAGENTVSVTASYGWIAVDSFSIRRAAPLPTDVYEVKPTLINPNATDSAKRLMTYLCDQYGKTVLSGQQSQDGAFGLTNAAVWRGTGGDYPAVLGMDLISYSPARVAKGDNSSNVVERAIEYWNGDEGKRGIVTLCWHWCPAARYDKSKSDPWGTFYTDKTKFNLARAMNGRDPDGYQMLLDDIDAIAVQLKRLQDADVPVLWRPLHEASGGWFWWGASGADAYLQLYKLMYDRLTNVHGLNNLIWVWNGQDAAWYPGDEYVDIIGEDIYPGKHVYTSQAARFIKALSYTDTRKLATKEERSKKQLFIPTEFTGIDIDDEGFVYASNKDTAGTQAVRRLNPKGEDVIRMGQTKNLGGDMQISGTSQYAGASTIVDVVYREKGIYSLLDSKRGRIITYDHEGNLLYIFGGLGTQAGTMEAPVAIECAGDKMLALDSKQGVIAVFGETEYGRLINEAVGLRYDGDETQAVALWQEVLRMDENNELANTGIGKAYLSAGDNEKAMEYLKRGMNRDYYSVAFKRYRNDVLKSNINYILTGIIAVIVAIVVVVKVIRPRRNQKNGRRA